MKHIYLLYCDEMEELACSIATRLGSITLCPIEWKRFPNGYPNLFLPWVGALHNKHVAFLASFSSPTVTIEQLSVIYEVPRMFASSFTLVLPFFPMGTSECIQNEGDIAMAFTLARMLSSIPLSRGGPTTLVTFDIHALQERFYFGDALLPCCMSGIPLLKRRLHKLPDADNVSIAFPNEGAWKRFHKHFVNNNNNNNNNNNGDFPVIVLKKTSGCSEDDWIAALSEGDPRDRHVVIVDDLVQSGSTLIECQKMLAIMGATRVSAYVTHAAFVNRSWEHFKFDNDEGATQGFSHVWITDSCPKTVEEVVGIHPFEVLSLADLILEALYI